ncbi:oxidoreductase [candidate division KSB1 bacterium]|nr:oxidoreductase [candidate division KSB1 bacterium]
MIRIQWVLGLLMAFLAITMCDQSRKSNRGQKFTGQAGEVRLITLDPGHFHAALVQKNMYPQVHPQVQVFAPAGPDLDGHLQRISNFNTRPENPTHWELQVYRGSDFLEKLRLPKSGNVVVLSGNNRKKIAYITAAVNAGLHVLADKPMLIQPEDFQLLTAAFAIAQKNGILLYDIMTERFEITTMLQKALSQMPAIFGTLLPGTPDTPAITKESVHHFYKFVAGVPLKRPAWYFDVTQQGEGLVDVTTHLVDLVQWECFPEQSLHYQQDVRLLSVRRWATTLSLSQFQTITGLSEFPDFLKKDIIADSLLSVYANGEIRYQLRGLNVKISVRWDYQAAAGAGDTHFSMMRGTRANLIIRQGAAENYRPELYVEPHASIDANIFETDLKSAWSQLLQQFPGLEIKKIQNQWQVIIPEHYRTGHEAHFGQVTEKFLQYLVAGKLPDWEAPNMLTKYYTTTQALKLARTQAGLKE